MEWITIYTPCLKKQATITALQDGRTITAGGVVSPYANAGMDTGGSAPYAGHKGIDWGVGTGTPVYAPVAGSVWTTYYTTGGNRLTITMSNGVKLGFNHLSKFVKTGGWVEVGDLVAYSGNTGTATTGPHLHVDVFGPSGECYDCWPYAVGRNKATPPTFNKATERIYRVQIGAYVYKSYADRQLARARQAGFTDGFVMQGVDAIHRVQIGAYTVKANAERCLRKAQAAGFKDAYIREVSV